MQGLAVFLQTRPTALRGGVWTTGVGASTMSIQFGLTAPQRGLLADRSVGINYLGVRELTVFVQFGPTAPRGVY